jgi:hypothetical protein
MELTEVGGSMFLRNVGNELQIHTAPKTQDFNNNITEKYSRDNKIVLCGLIYCIVFYKNYINYITKHGIGLGRLVAGIAGSNPAKSMDVFRLCLYVVLSCVCRGL